jgi:hypothetical protein
MKVMWNVRLFEGMTLFPRQVSDGDRRMDVYVKMVLVDNGLPKTYAIKVIPLVRLGMGTDCSCEIMFLWINCIRLSNRRFRIRIML